MAKRKGIFGKKRSDEYRKIMNNVNSKLNRVKKKFGVDESDNLWLPKKNEFESVKEYNEWKAYMKSFTNRSNLRYQYEKNQHGVVATKEEIREIETMNKIARNITDKINKDMEKKPFIVGGKVRGTVKDRRQMMADPDVGGINQIAEFDFDKIKSRRHLEKRKEMAYKRADEEYYDKRMETMKQNFIKQIELSFNSDGEELAELLRNIPADDFYEMYNMFGELDFADYDSEGQYIGADEPSNHVTQIKGYIERYYRGSLDFDLKDF